MSQNHSAEWLREIVAVLGRVRGDFTTTAEELEAEYRTLLAEAETRESAFPTAAEVIAAAEKALARTADHICDSSPYEVCIKNCPECLRGAALAVIAKWKEAHNA
jgi:hypothetical protein